MRRLLFSLLLFAGIVSIAQAEYVLIRVNVHPGEDPEKKNVVGEVGDGNMPPTGFMQNPELKRGEYVLVAIDAKREPVAVKDFGNAKIPFLTHRLGRTADFFDAQEISMMYVPAKVLKSPAAEYVVRRNELLNDRSRSADAQFELARWCVQAGLTDKAYEHLAELEKPAGKDETRSEKVTRAMAAWEKVKPILNNDVPAKTQANSWKTRLNYQNMATGKHYALVHNSDDPKRDGVDDKLKALEQNFRTVYLLFALKGKVLPAPREKLVAILSTDNDLFRKAADTFAVPERTNDGFHGPRENVVVFANTRLDKASQRFEQEMRKINQTYSVDLLKGQFRPLNKKVEKKEDIDLNREANNRQVESDARAQVLALVDALLREEADAATATQEGTRQIFVEAGLLPATVDLPEWLRFGLASVFEQPRGVFPLKTKDAAGIAFYPTAGGPNWEWRRVIDEMIKDNLLGDDPTDAVLDTLLDEWKVRAQAALAKPREEGDMSDPAAEAALETARGRAMAWAICHFLFNDRFDQLMAFGEELNKLPRDIELDRYAFLKIFCESFGIPTEGLSPTNLRGNAAGYKAFSADLMKSLRATSMPTVPVKWEEKKLPKKDDPNNPNRMN